MDFNALDQKFKDTLGKLEVPYDESSWQTLSNKLDDFHSLEREQSSDALLRSRLSFVEPAYDASSWALLSDKLDLERRRRTRMIWMKCAEAAVFLLLIANISNFFGEQEAPLRRYKYNAPLQADNSTPLKQGIRSGARTSNFMSGSASLALSSLASLAGLANDVNPYSQISATYSAGDSAKNIFVGVVDSIADLLSPDHFYNVKGTVAFDKLLPLPLKPALLMAHNAAPLAPISGLTQTHRQQSPWYAASFIAFNRDNIQPNANGKVDRNTGGGFIVGIRKKKWGLETGFAYASKSYTPVKKIEIYDGSAGSGYFGSYAAEVSAELVSIPVKVTRKLAAVGKSTVHAVAGVAANVAVQKEYRYKTVYYPGLQPQPGPSTPTNKPVYQRIADGVLENGALSDNAYVTGEFALRLERPLGKRYVAFVEPGFRSSLSNEGFGPGDTKVSGFSLQAGIMGAL